MPRPHGAGRSGADDAIPGPGRDTCRRCTVDGERYLSRRGAGESLCWTLFDRHEGLPVMSGAGDDHGPRLDVLERSLGELTARVEAADLVDLRQSVDHLRELLITIAEQIDDALTSR